jgi:NADPH-dependent 2,4-dienoyl-CoA reductase/sulfur reductase-like enzyme
VGCEAALYLAERGKRVTLLGRSREPAARVPTDLRVYLLWALAKRGIEVQSRAEVEEVVPGGVIYRDALGARRTLPADSVVFATGARPVDELSATLVGRVPAIFSIGDCNRPRGIREALREGYEVGLAI